MSTDPLLIKHPIKKQVAFWSICLIVVSGLLVYANSLSGEFIWDDEIEVLGNNEIRDWHHLPHLFAENIGTGAGRDYNFYRPVYVASLMADYSLGKLDVRVYHLTNVALHILIAICVYVLANLLFSNNAVSLLTALFFVVFPLHTEAVSYISGRADCLSAFFMLLSLIFYIRNFRSQATSIVLSSACFILAILSKENGLILPFLVLLYNYVFGGFKLKKFLVLIAIVFIYIGLRLTILYYPAPEDQVPTTLFDRIPGFFVAITNYARLIILPFNLHMEYGDMLFKLSNPQALLGILILALAGISAFKSRNNKLLTFSILWFFVCLMPQSNLYRINAYMYEHWLYLPSFGLFLILSHYLCLLYEDARLRALAVAIGIGLLSFYSFLTIKQNMVWRDPVSFYQRTIQYAPFSSRLYNNLARIYGVSGKYAASVELFKKALELSPRYVEAYNNLGVVYAEHGKNTEAIEAYKMAIALDPKFVGAYSNLGNVYGTIGKPDEAIAVFQKALKIKPDASVYNNLAVVYRDMKKNDEAIAAFKKAIAIDPGSIIVYFNLGDTDVLAGRNEDAIKAYKQIIALQPDNARAYNNIGFLLKKSGKNDQAIPFFDTAIKINPKIPQAYENLSLAYLNLGQNQKAMDTCDKAIEADPSNADRYIKFLNAIYKSINH